MNKVSLEAFYREIRPSEIEYDSDFSGLSQQSYLTLTVVLG